jgi:hypothetical protein
LDLALMPNNLEGIAFWVGVTAAILGGVALGAVLFLWGWASRFYRELVAKVAVAVFRFFAAGAAVASKLAPADPALKGWDQPWILTTVIAVIGYFLWEVVGLVGDSKHKQGKEKTAADRAQEVATLTQERDDADLQSIRYGRLLTYLREMVNEKVQRVRRVATASAGVRASLAQVREGLAPDEHIRIVLESLAGLLRMDVVSDGGNYAQNFRVGLYVERDGRLQLHDAFDLATKSHKPFVAVDTHADRFRLLNPDRPSHAVRCVLEGRTLIVADCGSEGGFTFFEERQRNYLRSLVAYPLTHFCPDGITPTRAALLVDTDVAGYFNEDDREMIEVLLKEFVVRLDLEYAIKGLTG